MTGAEEAAPRAIEHLELDAVLEVFALLGKLLELLAVLALLDAILLVLALLGELFGLLAVFAFLASLRFLDP